MSSYDMCCRILADSQCVQIVDSDLVGKVNVTGARVIQSVSASKQTVVVTPVSPSVRMPTFHDAHDSLITELSPKSSPTHAVIQPNQNRGPKNQPSLFEEDSETESDLDDLEPSTTETPVIPAPPTLRSILPDLIEVKVELVDAQASIPSNMWLRANIAWDLPFQEGYQHAPESVPVIPVRLAQSSSIQFLLGQLEATTKKPETASNIEQTFSRLVRPDAQQRAPTPTPEQEHGSDERVPSEFSFLTPQQYEIYTAAQGAATFRAHTQQEQRLLSYFPARLPSALMSSFWEHQQCYVVNMYEREAGDLFCKSRFLSQRFQEGAREHLIESLFRWDNEVFRHLTVQAEARANTSSDRVSIDWDNLSLAEVSDLYNTETDTQDSTSSEAESRTESRTDLLPLKLLLREFFINEEKQALHEQHYHNKISRLQMMAASIRQDYLLYRSVLEKQQLEESVTLEGHSLSPSAVDAEAAQAIRDLPEGVERDHLRNSIRLKAMTQRTKIMEDSGFATWEDYIEDCTKQARDRQYREASLEAQRQVDQGRQDAWDHELRRIQESQPLVQFTQKAPKQPQQPRQPRHARHPQPQKDQKDQKDQKAQKAQKAQKPQRTPEQILRSSARQMLLELRDHHASFDLGLDILDREIALLDQGHPGPVLRLTPEQERADHHEALRKVQGLTLRNTALFEDLVSQWAAGIKRRTGEFCDRYYYLKEQTNSSHYPRHTRGMDSTAYRQLVREHQEIKRQYDPIRNKLKSMMLSWLSPDQRRAETNLFFQEKGDLTELPRSKKYTPTALNQVLELVNHHHDALNQDARARSQDAPYPVEESGPIQIPALDNLQAWPSLVDQMTSEPRPQPLGATTTPVVGGADLCYRPILEALRASASRGETGAKPDPVGYFLPPMTAQSLKYRTVAQKKALAEALAARAKARAANLPLPPLPEPDQRFIRANKQVKQQRCRPMGRYTGGHESVESLIYRARQKQEEEMPEEEWVTVYDRARLYRSAKRHASQEDDDNDSDSDADSIDEYEAPENMFSELDLDIEEDESTYGYVYDPKNPPDWRDPQVHAIARELEQLHNISQDALEMVGCCIFEFHSKSPEEQEAILLDIHNPQGDMAPARLKDAW